MSFPRTRRITGSRIEPGVSNFSITNVYDRVSERRASYLVRLTFYSTRKAAITDHAYLRTEIPKILNVRHWYFSA